MFFRRRKGELDRIAPEARPVDDTRAITGSSATLSNVGPSRTRATDEGDDIIEGTSSGSGIQGKPPRGSRERGSL